MVQEAGLAGAGRWLFAKDGCAHASDAVERVFFPQGSKISRRGAVGTIGCRMPVLIQYGAVDAAHAYCSRARRVGLGLLHVRARLTVLEAKRTAEQSVAELAASQRVEAATHLSHLSAQCECDVTPLRNTIGVLTRQTRKTSFSRRQSSLASQVLRAFSLAASSRNACR